MTIFSSCSLRGGGKNRLVGGGWGQRLKDKNSEELGHGKASPCQMPQLMMDGRLPSCPESTAFLNLHFLVLVGSSLLSYLYPPAVSCSHSLE